jgi:large subunit ribosomal protein L21
VPKPDGVLSAVVVSGGKQYRVALGDRILVDRIAAEPGSSVKLDRVLLVSDGSEVKLGNPTVEGLDVDAKVIAHRRGPRTESIRYKSKKRVRVHRGGRSYLTALEIIAVGGVGLETEEKQEEEVKPRRRGRAAPRKKAAEPKPEAAAAEEAPVAQAPVEESEAKPKKRTTRRAKKEDSE